MASAISGKDFDSCFPPLGLSCSTSATKLGFSTSPIPTLLKRNNLVSTVVNSDFDLVAVLEKDKVLNTVVNHKSLPRATLFDVLEAITVPNNVHLEKQEGDTPTTVTQIKGLSNEIIALRKELDA